MNRPPSTSGRAVRAIRLALFAALLPLGTMAVAQQTFPTPEAAVDALIDGVSRNDVDQVGRVLGSDWTKYVPPETRKGGDVTNFLEAWSKAHRIVMASDAKAYLEVGTHGWTMPIPIKKSSAGWRFDTRDTPDELRTRRIGRNELDAIQVMLALTDAQRDYSAASRDATGGKRYAQKILSSPGKRDGLYWPTVDGEEPSPLGPIAADTSPGKAYHGYRYRVLTAQGPNAPKGARSYVTAGRMSEGFAFVAWPAEYGESGVMTFIVGDDAVVYQKNLGPHTEAAARGMTRFDPDSTWTRVSP